MDTRTALNQLEKLTDISESDSTLIAGLLCATQTERQIIARQRRPFRLLGTCVRSASACICKYGAKGVYETIEMLNAVKAGERKALWRYVCRHDAAMRLIAQMEKSTDKLRAVIGADYCEKILSALQQLIQAHRSVYGKVILFFAPYFYEDRLQDGYFQRVQAIDHMLPDEFLRIYVSWLENVDSCGIMRCKVIDDRHIEITRPYPHSGCDEIILRLAQMVGIVYHHSITFALEAVTCCKDIFKIYDMHGAYPEEERLYGRNKQADLDEQQERLAMRHGQLAICVTQQMVSHLQCKYPDMKAKTLLLPIYTEQNIDISKCESLPKSEKPQCVYAGGMQKWQCVEAMQRLIRASCDRLNYCIFTRTPKEFWRQWKGKRPDNGLIVSSRTPQEMKQEYLNCQYGLMLREDTVINRVACPTKLIEYLTYGIVPVMSSTHIGDFVADGMEYVSVQQLQHGDLPSEKERLQMAEKNRSVLDILSDRQRKGQCELIGILNGHAC